MSIINKFTDDINNKKFLYPYWSYRIYNIFKNKLRIMLELCLSILDLKATSAFVFKYIMYIYISLFLSHISILFLVYLNFLIQISDIFQNFFSVYSVVFSAYKYVPSIIRYFSIYYIFILHSELKRVFKYFHRPFYALYRL